MELLLDKEKNIKIAIDMVKKLNSKDISNKAQECSFDFFKVVNAIEND